MSTSKATGLTQDGFYRSNDEKAHNTLEKFILMSASKINRTDRTNKAVMIKQD